MSFRFLRLSLNRPIRYRSIPADGSETAGIDGTIEDRADFYELEDLRIDGGMNGPDIRWPAAEGPRFRGAGPAAEGTAEIGQREIPPGEYALTQADGAADAGALAREFLREAWWRGVALRGPLVVRRVREDGKEALQILCPASFPVRPPD